VRAIAETCAICFAPATSIEVGKHAAWLADTGSNVRLDWVRTFLRRGFATLETLLQEPGTGRFCHGDDPGMADCMLIPHVVLARRVGVPLEMFPRILAISIRCSAEMAFAVAATGGCLPPRDPAAAQD
jgi:maleylacetoacetate isomerase